MTSQNYEEFGALEELDSYLLDPSYEFGNCNNPDVCNHLSQFSVQTYEQNCAFEPSSASASGSHPPCASSSNESCGTQPDCLSDTTNNDVFNNCPLSLSSPYGLDCLDELKNDKLGEAEAAMQRSLAPDSLIDAHNNQLSSEFVLSHAAMEIVGRRDLKEMLVACAKAVGDNDLVTRDFLMYELQLMVSVSGEPLQRLGAYMLEGLVARLANSGSSIYKALRCKEPSSPELLSYMHLLYEACPYFKFGYLSANGAIAEAMKNENRIHIVDFQITQGTQWFTLIQALATRPGGPPQVRITGIDDSFSANARGVGLQIVGQRLSGLAQSCGVPFEFCGLAISSCDIESEHLGVRPGEALAVNFAMVLHHIPDESVGVQNHRDRILRMVKNLSPKVVTLVEHESNTNTAPFLLRFTETLDYYLAIFESIDEALSRDHKERINVEQHCLARDIVNIIACEGLERVERHEPLGKWRLRLSMAGFNPFPLSSFVNATIKNLLENYSRKYTLEEGVGCLYLGWMNRDLVASSAWI
ncbi:hypothetical protein SASPL_114263 [Salvia splendens]|uniref:DELLA protein n=1 Tax=Salvia splendens TaxID=180675 RepID=A0A8X8Y5M9_SALSN|nr:scarecrow-like protein 21 [Salvia splendens]KAG6423858.1 hypothetical protein SASPL_114263 [Salvia splendens]